MRGALIAASGVAGIVLLCKVVGFGEKIVVAHYLGTSRSADCYYVALSFVWMVVFIAAGVLQPSVLPVYVATSTSGSRSHRNQFAAAIAAGLALLTAGLCILVFLWPRVCVRLVAPGLPEDANAQAASLLQALVPGLGVLTFTALTRTILNANQQFAWAALGELVFRIIFFCGLAFGLARPGMHTLGAAFALGGVAGLVTHLAAIVWRSGWPLALPGRQALPALRQTALLAAPLLVGYALSHISQVADSILASLLGEGRISSLMYARKLVDAIVLLGPVTLATVLFSRFAALAAEQGPSALRLHVLQAIRGIVLISGPISVLVVVLRHTIVRTLFEHGQFDATSTALTSSALACYGLGIVAFSLDAALVSTFFALRDTRTPVLVGIATTAADLLLAYLLMQGMGHAGIALSAALTKTVKVVWLARILDRRLDLQIRSGLLPTLVRAGMGLAAMAIVTCIVQYLWHLCPLPAGTVGQGMSLIVRSACGVAVFLCCGCWCGIAECSAVWQWLRRRRSASVPADAAWLDHRHASNAVAAPGSCHSSRTPTDTLRVAYVLGTFPQPSERFALREILELQRQGCHVLVLALARGNVGTDMEPGLRNMRVLYRPRLFSVASLASLRQWLRHPASLCRLLWLICVVGTRSPAYSVRLVRNFHTVALFARAVRRERIGCIHGYFLSLPGLLAMAISASTRIPFTLAGHARDVFVEPAPLTPLLSRAGAVMVCNRDAAQCLEQATGGRYSGKIHLVHHGVELDERTLSRTGPAEGPPLILAAGRWVPKKGYAVLLRSGALLCRRGVRFRLILAGDGPCRQQLPAQIERDDLAACVQCPGWLSQAVLRTLLQQASMLVMPSIIAEDADRDGIPNIVLEAAAAGIPTVGSQLAGISEFVRHGQTGLLVPPGDPVALADAIELLLHTPDLCRTLGQRARDLIEREYNVRDNVTTIRHLLSASHGAARP